MAKMKKDVTSVKNQPNLVYKKTSAWEVLPPAEEKLMQEHAKRYLSFLGSCKTERETLTWLETEANRCGFKPLEALTGPTKLKAGAKVKFINKNRAMGLAVIGRQPITEGLHIVAAHHDVPHLDLKALPLYEKYGLALMKTHYYGGVKKFQWAALPLALHGFVITKNGKTISFAIGEKPDEPVFTITDLPPHLSYKLQNDRKATEVLKGEELNILVGNRPRKSAKPEKADKNQQSDKNGDVKGEEKVKGAVLDYLYQTWGLVEEDLAWAEVSAVPAFAPREVGFNRELIGGFGHDDRACVMAAFEAICQVKVPEYTCAVIFFDKEEIGSAGASGAQSMMIPDFFTSLIERTLGQFSYATLRQTIRNSYVLSGDTNAPIDPTFDSAWDPSNSGYLGNGFWITKFTGSAGKANSSEADVEFIAKIRDLLVAENIPYQFGEMGKVDEGGGGTVAKFLAQLNMHVLDVSLPVLSLHSPFEILSKVDYYYTIKAYHAFLSKAI